MATWRRIALLVGLSLAIWLFFHVSTESLLTVEPADFARMQESEHGFYGFKTEEQEYLQQLPLDEYIAEKIRDRVVSVSGDRWSAFFRDAAAASSGENEAPEWTSRVSPEQMRWRSTPYEIFFRIREAPLADVADQVLAHGPESSFLRLQEDGKTQYLKVTHRVFTSDDFELGTGLLGSPRPPTSFLYPGRPVAFWVLLAAVAAYFLIPWKKRDPDAICYPYRLVGLGDLVAMILFVPFFGLPIFVIGGSLQAFTTPAIVLTLVLWPFALASVWLCLYMADYESYQILIRDDGLEVHVRRRHDFYAFDTMDHWEPLELRSPRWLMVLLWLAALTGKGARSYQAAGQAMILGETSTNGIGIWLKNGSAVYLWITSQMGRQAAAHANRLLAALDAAAIPPREGVKVIRSVTMPEGEGRAVAASSRYRDWTLWAVLFAPLVVVGGAAIWFSVVSTVRKIGHVIETEHESESPETPPTLGELTATGVVWEKTIRIQDSTMGQALIETADYGFLIAGVTWQPGSSQQFAVAIKTDSDGEVVWSKTFGKTRVNRLQNVVAMRNGDVLLLGHVADRIGPYANQELCARRITADGELSWERVWSRDEEERPTAYDAAESDNGTIVIWGGAERSIHRFELSESGEVTAAQTHDLSDQVGEGAIHWISATTDGGSIATGETLNPAGGYKDLFLTKLGPDGNVAWKRTFGGKRKESGMHVRQLASGAFVAVGITESGESRDQDVYVIRTSGDGTLQWEHSVVKPGEQSAQRVSVTPEGIALVVGESRPASDSQPSLFFVELDSNGTSIQSQQITRKNATYTGNDAIAATDGTRLLLGSRSPQEFKNELMLIKLKAPTGSNIEHENSANRNDPDCRFVSYLCYGPGQRAVLRSER